MMCCDLLGAVAPPSSSINPWWVTVLLLTFLIPACVGVFVIREGWLRRIGILLCVTSALVALQNWWLFSSQPMISSDPTVSQLSGGNGIAKDIQLFETTKDDVQRTTQLIVLVAVVGCFSGYIKTGWMKLKGRRAISAEPALRQRQAQGKPLRRDGCARVLL